ncbi:MAG: polysaccharide deacetylase family protein, partial [Selenomonadaceae bacterium]|nr:polysaccharide deacetylase family protein [Selenomonadaceae bacterium]
MKIVFAWIKRFLGILAGTLMAFLLYLYATPAPKGFPVLEYHMVTSRDVTLDDSDAYAYNVPPEDFREQLDYLQQQGYTTISMLEYMKARKGKAELPEKPIILTFDDGYMDNYAEMLPILEEHGMKATVYMVTNDIGTPGYLGWEELRAMQERGVEIVPAIQTLAHFPHLAKLPAYSDIFDVDDVLMIGDPRVYALIDRMFQTMREFFLTDQIN